MNNYIYNIENLTPKQVEIAYKTDITQICKELQSINQVMSYPERYEIPTEKMQELEGRETELTLKLHDLEVEFKMVKLLKGIEDD